jgi:glycosyltransferase involved in cell wall biosynthesis/SAM-dependent methyltransferase
MNKKPLMICIHCGGLPFNGETIPNGESLGGSESAAYFMAKELAKLGHKVVVFTNLPKPGRWDDVIYDHVGTISEQAPLGDRFHYAMKVPWDAVIIQRHPFAFMNPVNSKCNIWWLHDLALHRFSPMVERQAAFIDQVFTVSEFHKDQVATVYGIDKEFITPTWNGVDYSLFEKIRKNPPARDRKMIVFASRPERGLQELVGEGGIMELLPEFDLSVCGYDNTTREMAGLYQYLWQRCEELPNVKNFGPLGKKDLYDLLARAGAYVYPTTFEDTSNIMLLEANAVGTPFIGPADHAALPETGNGAGFVEVPMTTDSKIDKQLFANTIRSVLNNDSAWEKLSAKALAKNQSWESAAVQWENEIYRILSEKSSNTFRLTKHLEQMSDIAAVMELHNGDIGAIEKILPDFSTNYNFFLSKDPAVLKAHYDAYYEYEKERGVTYGPEDLFGNARFEHTSNVIGEIAPRTLLDYGCAHGHFVMNLLRKFPNIQITGMDINQRNIDSAIEWANKDNPPVMPEFILGEIDALPEDRMFDCILLGEVLEHIIDPVAFVEKVKTHLNPNGHVVITTPYGPWEAIGYKKHVGWRSHVHHFERWDMFDMFSEQPEYKLIAIPFDYQYGHYLTYFRADGPPCKSIDYARKFATQSPRETVSLCMIARDAEHTLGQTLTKLKDVVDEIHVVIDEATTDKTQAIAEQFGAQVSFGKSPMETGFAAARNESLKAATCDWVLWVDADEHFERTENLARYLRRSLIMGFGIPQHHFSEEPPGILKTDFPCRLFRNHRGVQFFGYVHEHPELSINEGVGKVSLINDLGIMHYGYATENIRRERFRRNWPLMVEDYRINPNRTLGQFLWMRDLAHMAKYTLERNGGQMTKEIAGYAEEAIKMWDLVLDGHNLRMIADGLQYYSESVSHLTNGNGIEYSADIKAKRGQLTPTIPPMRGYFLNSEHVRKFAKIVNDEAVKIYEEKYF